MRRLDVSSRLESVSPTRMPAQTNSSRFLHLLTAPLGPKELGRLPPLSLSPSSVTLDLGTRAGSWNRPLASRISHLSSRISDLASFISISSARANGSQKREPEVSILLGASPTGEARATLIVGREFEPELLLFLMETDQSSTVRTPQAKIS